MIPQPVLNGLNWPITSIVITKTMPQTLTLPPWLKSGPAVFRWEWTHISAGGGASGQYAQCADITVVGGGTEIGTPTVTIPGHLPATYRNIDGTGAQTVAGPIVASRAGAAPQPVATQEAPTPCTTDADCTVSGVCTIDGVCYVEAANHAIGATVFFLLAFIACGAVLAYVLVTKKDQLFNTAKASNLSTRFDDIDDIDAPHV